MDAIVSGVYVSVAGARDAVNDYEQTAAIDAGWFRIDTLDAWDRRDVSYVDSSVTLVTDAAVAKTQPGFWVRVGYDQPMDTSVDPTIGFSADVSSTLTNVGYWVGSQCYVAHYDVSDDNVPSTAVAVNVSGGKDPYGNAPTSYTGGTPLFTIDTADQTPAPTSVKSVSPEQTMITKDDAGNIFYVGITFDYSQSMDIRVSPTIALSNEQVTPDPAVALTGFYGYWVNDHSYYSHYTVSAETAVNIAHVDLKATGAIDATGQTQPEYHGLNVFSINTNSDNHPSPHAVNNSPSKAVLTDADVGTGTFSVTVTYNTAMDTTTAPSLTFETDPPATKRPPTQRSPR